MAGIRDQTEGVQLNEAKKRVKGGKLVAISTNKRPKSRSLSSSVVLIFKIVRTSLSSIEGAKKLWIHTICRDVLEGLKRFGVARTFGIVIGTLLMYLNMMPSASAQVLFTGAEAAVNATFGAYIDTAIITFLFGAARFLAFGGVIGLVGGAIAQGTQGRNWEPWVAAVVVVAIMVAVLEVASQLIFG